MEKVKQGRIRKRRVGEEREGGTMKPNAHETGKEREEKAKETTHCFILPHKQSPTWFLWMVRMPTLRRLPPTDIRWTPSSHRRCGWWVSTKLPIKGTADYTATQLTAHQPVCKTQVHVHISAPGMTVVSTVNILCLSITLLISFSELGLSLGWS